VEESFSDRWKFNVEKYTDMKLTVESDRYIAFLGIIKYVEETTGLECMFGLWKEHLLMAHRRFIGCRSYASYLPETVLVMGIYS